MNYYEILKISRDANEEEIKSAYKKLVKKYHPDLYVADKDFAEKKIKEINEAYDILSSPDSREEYDLYLDEIGQNEPQVSNEKTNYSYQSEEIYQEQKFSNLSFGHWIFSKLERFNKRTQIKIFLIFLFILLLVFLNNIIKLKNTLQQNNVVEQYSPREIQNTVEYPNNYDYYNYYDNEEMRQQWNQFYNELMGEYMNDIMGY